MRIVFMGTPAVAAVSLERLIKGPDPVVGVVTQPDRAAGRGQTVIPAPVRKVAEREGIAVLTPEKMRDPAFLSGLNQWAPQLIVVVAYGRILPRQILDLPPLGCLNVHYSLLPRYRGAAPVAWAVINGAETSGVTTMQLVEKMDAGPIFLQREISLAADDTAGSLQTKLAPIGAELLMETIAKLKGGSLMPRAQNEQEATYAPLLKKEDGLIDWRLPAAAIERRVRGLSPWPSAYTQLDGKLLKIHRATVITSESRATPGEVVRADKEALWIATGEAILSLDVVQLENKKRLPAADFLRGAKIEKGARL